jgi:hypothetical protein
MLFKAPFRSALSPFYSNYSSIVESSTSTVMTNNPTLGAGMLQIVCVPLESVRSDLPEKNCRRC